MPLVVQSYKQPCSGRRATTILLLYEVGLLLLLDKVEESKWERVVVSGKTEDKIVQEEEPPPGIDSTRNVSILISSLSSSIQMRPLCSLKTYPTEIETSTVEDIWDEHDL